MEGESQWSVGSGGHRGQSEVGQQELSEVTVGAIGCDSAVRAVGFIGVTRDCCLRELGGVKAV